MRREDQRATLGSRREVDSGAPGEAEEPGVRGPARCLLDGVTEPSTLREALQISLDSGNPPTLTVVVTGGRELTGRLRAVADEFIVMGAGSRPYRVALAHIMWLQES